MRNCVVILFLFPVMLTAQNVGINTSSPLFHLDVRASGVSQHAFLNLASSDNMYFTRLLAGHSGAPNSSLSWTAGTAFNFGMWDEQNQVYSQVLQLSQLNRVGINTFDPAFSLDVRGLDDFGHGGELQLATPGQTNFLRLSGGRLGDPHPFISFTDTDTFHIASSSADWSTFTRRMTFTPDGKVGINTLSPKLPLDVRGITEETGSSLQAATPSQAHFIRLFSGNTGAPHPALLYHESDTFHIVSTLPDLSTYQRRVTVLPNGKVGINDEIPSAMLEVHGDADTTIIGRNDGFLGIGVHGYASATVGNSYGVYGVSNSTSGKGVYGINTAGSGSQAYGLYGISESSSSAGVGGYAPAPTGPTSGVYGVSSSTSGRGVLGVNTAGTGVTYGIYGQSNSTLGRGVYGNVIATSGNTTGVYGQVSSTQGRGVFGKATATTGYTYGVYGYTESESGTGVNGYASSDSGLTYGVYGHANSSSTNTCGVKGKVSASTGATYGVWGESASDAGRGVRGIVTATSGETFGVYGQTESTTGHGVHGLSEALTGVNYGVWGEAVSTSGRGVYGFTPANTGTTFGVYGESESSEGRGVYGLATSASGFTYGVRGTSQSSSGRGVYGKATSTTGSGYGVFGYSESQEGHGVHAGISSTDANAHAIHAVSGGGSSYAAYLDGKVQVTGTFFVNTIPFGDYANLQYNTTTDQFYYDNSSRRYKENIQALKDDFTKVLEAQPVQYTRPGNPDRIEIGYIAEDMEALGLDHLIGYDAEGQVENFNYEKMILYVVEVMKAQQQQLEKQQELIDQLLHAQDTQSPLAAIRGQDQPE